MAYPGEYAQQGQGHWYELLTKLLSGLKGAGQGIGQGVGAVGQGAAGALSSVGPQLPEILKILGSIGKGVGQTATMVGRQLPYAGPLIQAGEYGILNAVGKEDSPWAQGNAFVQRDKANQEQEMMAKLLQAAQGLRNTGLQQENTQRDWESTQNPFTARENAAKAQGAETDVNVKAKNLEILTRQYDDILEEARLNPADSRIAREVQLKKLEIEQAQANIGLTGAQTETQNAYANKANAWEPSTTSSNIPEGLQKAAYDRAVAEFPGLGKLVYDISGLTRLSPQQKVDFQALYQKILAEMIAVRTRQQGLSGGWSINPNASTSMPGSADIIPGQTAGQTASPFATKQASLFWQKVQQTGQDPQAVLEDFIAGGILDPSKADPSANEAEAIEYIKSQIRAMAK